MPLTCDYRSCIHEERCGELASDLTDRGCYCPKHVNGASYFISRHLHPLGGDETDPEIAEKISRHDKWVDEVEGKRLVALKKLIAKGLN